MNAPKTDIFLWFSICLTLYIVGCSSLKTKLDILQPYSIEILKKLYSSLQNKNAIFYAQELLTRWEISDDDKPVILYILGDCYRKTGKFNSAQEKYEQILSQYPNAVLYDLLGVNIRIEYPCKLGIILAREQNKCSIPDKHYEFEDLAWKYYNKKNPKTSRRIIEIFFKQNEILRELAANQQKEFEQKNPLPRYSPNKELNNELEKQFWALNTVATLYFIKGRSLEDEADPLESSENVKKCRLYQEAINCYKQIVEKYQGAYCFDPTKPTYWKVARQAYQYSLLTQRVKMREIECNRYYQSENHITYFPHKKKAAFSDLYQPVRFVKIAVSR